MSDRGNATLWTVAVDTCAACRKEGRDGEYYIPQVDSGHHAQFANREDAALIVRSVNAHDKLVEACEALLAQGKLFNRDTDDIWVIIRQRAEAALALAKGETDAIS